MSCWNSFHNKLKSPTVGLDASRVAAGFSGVVIYRGRGGVGGAVQMLRWAPCVKYSAGGGGCGHPQVGGGVWHL